MPENVFYIFDASFSLEKLTLKIKEDNPQKIFLCLNAVDSKILTPLNLYLNELGINFEVVPFVKHFNENSIKFRDDYIKYISDFAGIPMFGGKNLKAYFKYPFKDFSLWWFSLIAEKNTLKSSAYCNLVKFLTICELQKKHGCNYIWMDICNKELVQAVKINCRNNNIVIEEFKGYNPGFIFLKIIRYIFKTLFLDIRRYIKLIIYMKKEMGGLKNRLDILDKCKYLLVTHFPLIDKDKLKEGKFVNKYYQPLQKALETKCSGRFAWLALICPGLDGYNWYDSVKMGREINDRDNNLFFCEEWLDFKSICEAILVYFFFSIKFLFKARTIVEKFKYGKEDFFIWSLFESDWLNSFTGFVLFEGICYYKVFSDVFKKIKNNSVVLYMAEMHAWEKALNVVLRGKKNLKDVAIQHTIVSLLHLMYFNYKDDLLDGNYIDKIPKPDYLACVGKIPYNLFIDSGWSKDRVFILGPIRSQHYRELLKKNIPWSERKNRIIVALSIGFEEAKEVLCFVHDAFNAENNFEILIKGHPANPVRPIMDSLNIKPNSNFKIVDVPLNELIVSSRVLITTASSASLESIAGYCPVIVPMLISAIDMNPLSWISDIQIGVENPAQLREIASKIILSQEQYISSEKCRKLIENYCSFLDSSQQFLENLEQKVRAYG